MLPLTESDSNKQTIDEILLLKCCSINAFAKAILTSCDIVTLTALATTLSNACCRCARSAKTCDCAAACLLGAHRSIHTHHDQHHFFICHYTASLVGENRIRHLWMRSPGSFFNASALRSEINTVVNAEIVRMYCFTMLHGHYRPKPCQRSVVSHH